MKYVGIQTQIWRNNFRSMLLLLLFPLVLYGLIWLFIYFVFGTDGASSGDTFHMFMNVFPWATGMVLIWFLIAYFSHTSIINSATGAKTLERKDNKRVYNLVENLCITMGMKTPKINIIPDDSLNAYASGINERSYTVALSRGIINKLDDAELESVIAHELSHIRNKDVRLMIVSIIFVGIFAFIAQMAMRSALYGRRGGGKKDGRVVLLIMVLAFIGYFISIFFRFAISRKREYLADAGAAEMTRNPKALASALRKVSQDPRIESVTRDDVAQLFIEHPTEKAKEKSFSLSSLFATHPPISKRIQILENF